MKSIKGLILSNGGLPLLLLMGTASCLAQDKEYDPGIVYATLSPAQQKALHLLASTDTLAKSTIWPHIKQALFFANIRKNILYPAKINQGNNTNFCNYAALTHLLIRYEPDHYTQMILSLYQAGKTSLYSKRIIKASQQIRNAAGLLANNGQLNILHADLVSLEKAL